MFLPCLTPHPPPPPSFSPFRGLGGLAWGLFPLTLRHKTRSLPCGRLLSEQETCLKQSLRGFRRMSTIILTPFFQTGASTTDTLQYGIALYIQHFCCRNNISCFHNSTNSSLLIIIHLLPYLAHYTCGLRE